MEHTGIKNVVEQLKECGESIILNAESIVGSERYATDIIVTIKLSGGEAPVINIDRDFLPEKFVERCKRSIVGDVSDS